MLSFRHNLFTPQEKSGNNETQHLPRNVLHDLSKTVYFYPHFNPISATILCL